MSSLVVKAIALYLASTLDYLLSYEIMLHPIRKQYLDIEHQSKGENAQLASI